MFSKLNIFLGGRLLGFPI